MDQSKQKQSAGDNSTQVQAGTINVTNIVGIDDKRAREICREEYALAKQNWTAEAYEIADKRVQAFENRLMPRMVEFDNSLKCFADPAFQFALRKAQIVAASSERDDDYNILTELLVNRVELNTDRKRQLGIVKAIEVVDQIDEIALIGLSMVFAVSNYYPVSVVLSEGLKVLDSFYAKILSGKQLPEGDSWLTHLDLLSTIRILDRGMHRLKKIEKIIPPKLKKYLVKGIRGDAEEFKLLKDKLLGVGISTSCFVPYILKEGYYVWSLDTNIDHLFFIKQNGASTIKIPLNDAQKTVMKDAILIACEDGSNDVELLNAFWKEWDKFENLAVVHKWWNTIEGSFDITPVGVALANAYVRGKDPSVPNLY